jgi:hypothetical protein
VPLFRATAFLVAAGAVLIGTLWGAREWQQAHLAGFLRTYEQAPARSVTPVIRKEGDRLFRDLSAVRPVAPSGSFPLQVRYWVADFDASACGLDVVDLAVAYEAPKPFYDASGTVKLVIGPRSSYLFATYELDGSGTGSYANLRKFLGLALPVDESACLVGVREVTDISAFALLPSVLFRPGWETGVLFQRIGIARPEAALRRPVVTVVSPVGNGMRRDEVMALFARARNVDLRAAGFRSPAVELLAEGFSVRAEAASSFSYLVQLPPRTVASGSYLVAEGEIFQGGISIGLISDGKWIAQVPVSGPNRFRAVIRVDAGTYELTVANNLAGDSLNHLRIDRIGWVEP